MEYLKVLDTVRAVTGCRGENRFPETPASVTSFRGREGSPATFFVFDAIAAKRVLESSNYAQFHFLDRVLTIAKPERTKWIRRFCDVGLIMIDGSEHERRREAMAATLEHCVERVKNLPVDKTTDVICEAAAAEGASAAAIGQELVRLLFSESIAAITGTDVVLPLDHLFQIDFFNPFPTLSTLARCDASIEVCCREIGLENMDASIQSAVLSLLIMGVSPLHALITAFLNQCTQDLREGLPLQDALARAAKIDSYSVVPTNFVMRESIGADAIEGHAVAAGDIVYLFLGSANGCPFSRHSAVPFGAGAHYCSGAKLTTVMMWAVRSALARVDRAVLARVVPSVAEQGKASAFLIFPAAR